MHLLFIVLLCLFSPITVLSKGKVVTPSSMDENTFYFGAMGGYGSTTWRGLVPAAVNQNPALSISTPIDANEGGSAWGLFAGYDFNAFFSVEASYIRYPDATVYFDKSSLFSFDHHGKTRFETQTDTFAFIAKVMMILPNTTVRVYSGAGVATIHREDMLRDRYRITPTFSIGGNYQINKHLMSEISGNYTAGYGESLLNPANSFMPFLFSLMFKLAYTV